MNNRLAGPTETFRFVWNRTNVRYAGRRMAGGNHPHGLEWWADGIWSWVVLGRSGAGRGGGMDGARSKQGITWAGAAITDGIDPETLKDHVAGTTPTIRTLSSNQWRRWMVMLPSINRSAAWALGRRASTGSGRRMTGFVEQPASPARRTTISKRTCDPCSPCSTPGRSCASVGARSSNRSSPQAANGWLPGDPSTTIADWTLTLEGQQMAIMAISLGVGTMPAKVIVATAIWNQPTASAGYSKPGAWSACQTAEYRATGETFCSGTWAAGQATGTAIPLADATGLGRVAGLGAGRFWQDKRCADDGMCSASSAASSTRYRREQSGRSTSYESPLLTAPCSFEVTTPIGCLS